MALPLTEIIGKALLPSGAAFTNGTIHFRASQEMLVSDGTTTQSILFEAKVALGTGGEIPEVAGVSTLKVVPTDAGSPTGVYYHVEVRGSVDGRPQTYKVKVYVPSSPTRVAFADLVRIAGSPPVAYTVRDATATAKGIVTLAGDLGGTASAPTVPGLASKVTAAGGDASATVVTPAGGSTARTMADHLATLPDTQITATGTATTKTLADWTKEIGDVAAAAGVYLDTTAGLAAVAEGVYFQTPSAIAEESTILYRKESGVAVEKKRYPSADAATKPIWTGRKNGWPDPFFRHYDLTSKAAWGRDRWFKNTTVGAFAAGWSRLAGGYFDGYVIRRDTGYNTTTLSGPAIWLDEIGAVEGDTVTAYVLVTGSSGPVYSGYRFDTGIDTTNLGSGSMLNAAGGTNVTASATPQWLRISAVVPAGGAQRIVLYPYNASGSFTFDLVACWSFKGAAAAGPSWPSQQEEGYQRIRDLDVDTLLLRTGSPIIAMPPALFVTTGREGNVYFENLTPAASADEFSWDVTTPTITSVARHENERWTYTPGGGHVAVAITIEARDKRTGEVLATASGTVKAAAAAAGAGQTPKCIFIGDSLTAAAAYTQELLNIAATDDLKIALYGTRGSGANLHEGRGGWKIADYTTDPAASKRYAFTVAGVVVAPAAGATYTHNGVTFTIDYADLTGGAGTVAAISNGGAPLASGTLTKASGTGDATITFTASGATSPFWIGGVVDFPGYLTAKSIPVPDWVFVMLGINDCFSQTTDAGVVALAATELTRLDTLIASAKAAGAGVKVGVMIPTPPSADQDAFGANYFAAQSRDRFKRNIVIWAREVIARYTGQSANRIYLVPTNVNLDTVNNMSRAAATPVNARSAITVTRQSNGVHPATDGYEQIADTVWSFLKCQF